MLTVDSECEDDGRWISEITAIPGVLPYGTSRKEAIAKAEALALRVLADRVEHGEVVPNSTSCFRRHEFVGIGESIPRFCSIETQWSGT